MAAITHLYEDDKTNPYRDASKFVATVKLLGAPKIVEEGNGLDDLGVILYTMQVPKNLPLRRLRSAIAHTFSSHGCGHSYDCCGCAVNNARTHDLRVIRRGQVIFPVSIGRNY